VNLLFGAEASQPNVGGWDASYALPGNTGTKQTTSSARRGALPMCVMWPLIEANGKPYKELVKIAHSPINCCRNPL
jgi:hypothetical protein